MDWGFIRSVVSPFAFAPIMFVRKKDCSIRLCADYKALIKMIVKSNILMPCIEYIFE